MSGDYKSRVDKSELSDYSLIEVIDDNQSKITNDFIKEILHKNLNLIRTKRDIYAEDILMTKIIHYVSQFSNDVKSYLGKLRSKDALMS